VVVGGATAGLLVAARLSEDERVRVGVLEAGRYVAPGEDPRIDLVVNYGLVFGDPKDDWNLKSVPQEGVGGRVVQETRVRGHVGCLLGGSSMISSVLWRRRSREESDVWGTELVNGPTWSFETLEPYFHKAENRTGRPIKTLPGGKTDSALGDAFGRDDPVQISYNNYYPGLIEESVAAANLVVALAPIRRRLGNTSGFFTPARAVDPQSGTRSSTLTGYFEPNANRENLVVLTGAEATRVLFEAMIQGKAPRVAEAVEFSISGGKKYTVKAKREVIVSAGTFKTPQLLELSGIGDRTLLMQFCIETLIDLPDVGENLIDQTYTLIDFVAKMYVRTLDEMRINATFAQQQITLHAETKTSILTYDTAATGSVPLQSILTKEEIELLSSLIPSPVSSNHSPLQGVQYQLLRKWFGEGEIGWAELLLPSAGGARAAPLVDTSYATPIVFHLHPFTRGSMHINSSDPLAPPIIDPKYFGHWQAQ
ncbi:GMC oxidoreductase-domain-containing protein, partial [Russula dissimulans]